MKPENLKCPNCGGEMFPRTNKTNQTKFWGCKMFPVCKGTRDNMGMSKEDRDTTESLENEVGETEYRWDRK